MNIMDQLARRISELKNPTVAGLDTRIEYLPEKFVQAILPEGIRSFEDAAEAVYQYNVRLVDALCDIVPAVKVQVAYYEMYGPAGMAAFERTMAYAKEKGLIVMADVKRNDIGATAGCYANAYVGATPMPPPTTTILPSSFAISDGRPSGPTKSRMVSPASRAASSIVEAPMAWNTMRILPVSRS